MLKIQACVVAILCTASICNAQCLHTSLLCTEGTAECNNTKTNHTCKLLYPASVAVFDAYDEKVYSVGQTILIVAIFPEGLCGLPQPGDISSECTPTMKIRLNTPSGKSCFEVTAAASAYQAERDYAVSFMDDYNLNSMSRGSYNHWVFPFNVVSGMSTPRLEMEEIVIPPACNVTDKYNFANWTRLDTRPPLPPAACEFSSCSNLSSAATYNLHATIMLSNSTDVNSSKYNRHHRSSRSHLPWLRSFLSRGNDCCSSGCDGACGCGCGCGERRCCGRCDAAPAARASGSATPCFTLHDMSGAWANHTRIDPSGAATRTDGGPNFTVSAARGCNRFLANLTDGAPFLLNLSIDRATIFRYSQPDGAYAGAWTRDPGSAPAPAPAPTPSPRAAGCGGGGGDTGGSGAASAESPDVPLDPWGWPAPPPPPPQEYTLTLTPPPPPPPPPARDNNTVAPSVRVDTRGPAIVGVTAAQPAGSYTAGDRLTLLVEFSRAVAFDEMPRADSQARRRGRGG